MSDIQRWVEVSDRDPELFSPEEFDRGYNKIHEKGVYGEWCRDPKLCADRGFCPRDPSCSE